MKFFLDEWYALIYLSLSSTICHIEITIQFEVDTNACTLIKISIQLYKLIDKVNQLLHERLSVPKSKRHERDYKV